MRRSEARATRPRARWPTRSSLRTRVARERGERLLSCDGHPTSRDASASAREHDVRRRSALSASAGSRRRRASARISSSTQHIERIAELATSSGGGTVVEIGAGLGALTEPLLARAAKVVAIERDRDLCPILREAFAEPIAAGQARRSWRRTPRRPTSARSRLGARAARPRRQPSLPAHRPAARERDLARPRRSIARCSWSRPRSPIVWSPHPRRPSYGALTVFVSAAFDVVARDERQPRRVPPRPGVDSAVVVLTPAARRAPWRPNAFAQRFARRSPNGAKRSATRGASSGPPTRSARAPTRAGIDLDRRGETLSVEEFARFAERILNCRRMRGQTLVLRSHGLVPWAGRGAPEKRLALARAASATCPTGGPALDLGFEVCSRDRAGDAGPLRGARGAEHLEGPLRGGGRIAVELELGGGPELARDELLPLGRAGLAL